MCSLNQLIAIRQTTSSVICVDTRISNSIRKPTDADMPGGNAERQLEKLPLINLSDEDSDRPAGVSKCVACFKQFKQKAFFIEHMQKAGHSPHDPRCAHCQKHCRCLDALREHLTGPLAKKECAMEFAQRGCSICLNIFENVEILAQHHHTCQLTASTNNAPLVICGASNARKRIQGPRDFVPKSQRPVVALDCEMVGGGPDGAVDLCARICIINENETVLINTFVKPELPVTDYRFEITGVYPEDLEKGMPIKAARKAVEEILYNGSKNSHNASLLVGHSLHHDLNCLGIEFPIHLQRDTAYYPPLLRTSNVCNKLQYLANTYLGYKIQEGKSHDPLEDAIAAMRLYKRMRNANHNMQGGTKRRQLPLYARPSRELETMTPEELLELSEPRFRCWCLDN
ncbi:hypothetical protein KP509_07G039500 [Ceratopteris richardii]|uniref:RNA exonuclease 4 n=1 Tax=Ceratopteris richardii TaxID=49495 RepID=A0A8T2UDN8_CERRI|nr:hypothetical protein KP509_07G039500 [Ceratopteris richardii]